MKFMMNFVFRKVRYTMEKEDSDAYQSFLHFSSVVQSLHFQQCCPKSSFSAVLSKVFIFSSVVQSLHFQQCFPKSSLVSLTLSSIYTHFSTLKRKKLGKHCGTMRNCSRMSNLTISAMFFYVICI